MKTITLTEALQKRTVEELRELAKFYEVRGYSKLRKNELAEVCAAAIQKEESFEESILLLSERAWEFYKKATDSADGLEGVMDSDVYLLPNFLGILHAEKSQNGVWTAVPEELKPLCKKLQTDDFAVKKEEAELCFLYAEAAINLYGVISSDELYEIVRKQTDIQTEPEAFCSLLYRHLPLDASYFLFENYLADCEFEGEEEELQRLIQRTEHKPRYIPEREEFLRYEDWNYREDTKQMAELKKFLLCRCHVSSEEIAEIMDTFHWQFVREASPEIYFDLLEGYGIVLNEQQAQAFVRLIMECANHSRIWSNRGYTPNEMVAHYARTSQRKVGRNEPCPCGSGKKYKRCCGR